MVAIELHDVGVELGRRAVLHGISTSFQPGQLIGIVGPNGAGKSTLVHALLGLVPHRGQIRVDGETLATIRRSTLARRIAYLPQGQTLHWPLAVERLVGLGRLPHLAPMSRIAEADHAAIYRAMERAEVLTLRDRMVTELSGGERARVLLARALAVEAPALVADEPLAALDPRHQMDVMELLASEARAGGLVVVVLHDLTMAARYCDRLLLLNEGRLVAEGPPLQVLNAERLATVYGIEARIDTGAQPLIIPLGRAR